MIKLRNQLAAATGLLIGIVGHHYGSKLLEFRETMAAAKEQELKDQAAAQNIGEIKNNLSQLTDQSKTISNQLSELANAKKISDVKLELASQNLDTSKAHCDTVKEILEKGSEQVTPDYYSKAYKAAVKCQEAQNEAIKALKSLIDDISKNNLIPGLENLYNYLNSLNLLELSALFNILILFLICILLINIIVTNLSNELINYFNLEKRFPKISNILK